MCRHKMKPNSAPLGIERGESRTKTVTECAECLRKQGPAPAPALAPKRSPIKPKQCGRQASEAFPL